MSKIWHPFTQEKTAQHPLEIIKGSEEYLFDASGKRYIDMVSSWWVNILGHANPDIADAISAQAHTLEHVIFAGFSHEPAEQLVAKLSKFLPNSLSKFFFSDDGSTAVEVALKMCYQSFTNRGMRGRNVFINLQGGYHGDTLGAMSAAGCSSEYHSTFGEFFFQTFSIKFPKTRQDETDALAELEKFLAREHEKVCALIVEPLVQGAAGMRMYTPRFLDAVVNVVKQHGILVIFDEVMTGFFRTGTMFAFEQCSVVPDVICLSKGLTGGFLPLSLTVVTESIYEAFLSDDWKKAFIHGHSYTANPIACAAALKAQELLQTPAVQENMKRISQLHAELLAELPDELIRERRHLGTIAAVDLTSSALADAAKLEMLEKGVIIRPLGNTVYFIPPYCISEQSLRYAYQCLRDFLQSPQHSAT